MLTVFWNKIKNIKIPSVVFLTLMLIYWETVLRVVTCDVFWNKGLIFMSLFAITFAVLLDGIYHLPIKRHFAVLNVFVVLTFLLYGVQIVYCRFFNKFLIIYSLISDGVGQLLSGGTSTGVLSAIIKAVPFIALLTLPMIAYVLFFKYTTVKTSKYIKYKLNYSILCGVTYVVANVVLITVISFLPSSSSIQNGMFDITNSVAEFGLLRSEVLDIKYNLLGVKQKFELETTESLKGSDEGYGANVVGIDFAKLTKSERNKTLLLMNKYFENKTPTYKNKYTGMYAGYNLVMVVAEGFSPYAIDENLTPTLYKMQQDGFDFTNFYTPIWGVSTTDGEYTASTGLVPKSGVWSFLESSDNYMPYCMGNAFKNAGYNSNYAYHNNNYKYYRRDLTHVNMGYDYKGLGNGVEEYVENLWPQSDLEMVLGSLNDYINSDEPFCVHYMTVSGHLDYEQGANAMVDKNWDLVKNLNCSDTLKAYYACNIELDRAMEALLSKLNEKGIADKTVIALTPDHYPYGLEQDSGDVYSVWNEILGHEVDTEFELYESCFLLYCQGTKKAPTVDKYCFSADIVPTLLNLFGFEYDSRLLVGRDILSNSEGLVIFSDGSFITDYGKYNVQTDEFTSFENTFATEEEMDSYVENMISHVSNTMKLSAKILETDYYGYVFGK